MSIQTHKHEHSLGHEPHAPASFVKYTLGFILSVVLTLQAYFFVVNQVFSPKILLLSIGILAILQFIVQAVFFLHVGEGKGTKWNAMTFGFMLMVVAIVVVGSLWIMYNLDYNHQHNHEPSPSEIDEFIFEEEAIYR